MPRGNPTCPRGQPLSGRHARIPIEWISAFSKLDAGQASVLLAILSHADSNGQNAYPSLRTIAEIAGLQESSVSEALNRLKRNGWIDWTSGGGRRNPNKYSFPFWDRHRTEEEPLTYTSVQDRGVSAETNSAVQERKTSGPDTQTPRKSLANSPFQNRGLTERTDGTLNNTERVVDGSTSNGCEDLTAEKVRLLTKKGVSEKVARQLAADFSLPRIRTVVDQAVGQERGPGWIVKALKQEWEFEKSDVKNKYDPDARKLAVEEAKQWAKTLSSKQWEYVVKVVIWKCPAAKQPESGDEEGVRLFWAGTVKGRRDNWFPGLNEYEPPLKLVRE